MRLYDEVWSCIEELEKTYVREGPCAPYVSGIGVEPATVTGTEQYAIVFYLRKPLPEGVSLIAEHKGIEIRTQKAV